MTRMRLRTLGVLVGAVLLLGGCATKRDVRTIQQQMQQMQDRQAELLRDIQRQNRLLLDSIRATMTMTQDVRGSTTGQLRQFEQSVTQLGNLVGQIMGTLTRIEQRLTVLEQRPTASVTVSSTSNPDSLYNEGMQRMSDARYAVARTLFEEIVSDHTTHPLAPDAQFQIGQIYALEKNYAAAYSELEKVAAQWSQSPRAPAALVRAAAIAEEEKNIPKAREYYTQVRDRYAGTDEARQATRKLQTLPRRE